MNKVKMFPNNFQISFPPSEKITEGIESDPWWLLILDFRKKWPTSFGRRVTVDYDSAINQDCH